MTYQVLARKWRPQDFSSLVGQEHVVTALGNGLRENRVAQAYLFSGIRGVGKTTAARVLAKALNCEKGPQADPCNECATCREITEGHSLDVIEVDAATYSKVEQVRELTESLRYGPARGRYKVVVLDEVHRLSRQAFDALLKIVEEPPAHLVFIFATTEIDAVPATILSRCQEFQFRRVPSPVLAEHLRTLCNAENITASDAALRMIARAGEGSVRDSVALLDQMSTFGSGTISDEDAQQLLGGFDTAVFQNLLSAILEGRGLDIVNSVREIEASGWDPSNVYSQFLIFVRDALHLGMGGDISSIDLPEEEAIRLRDQIKPHGYESLLQILQLLIESEPIVRRSELSLLALEIAWLRAAELPKVARIQDILAGIDSGGGMSSPPANGGGRGSSSSQAYQASAPHEALPSQPASTLGTMAPQEYSAEPPSTATPQMAPPAAVALPAEAPPAKNLVSRQIENSPTVTPSFPRAIDSTSSIETRTEDPCQESATEQSVAEPESELPTCDPARLPDVLEILGTRRQSLAAHLSLAALRIDRRTLLIVPPAGDTLLESALGRSANVDALDQALTSVWGPKVYWKIDLKSARRSDPAEDPARPVGGSPPGRARPVSGSPPSRPERPVNGSSPSPQPRAEPSRFDGGPPEPSMPDWAFEQNSQSAFAPPPDWQPPLGPPSSIPEDQLREVTNQPVVRSLLEIFGGKIQRVEEASVESPQ